MTRNSPVKVHCAMLVICAWLTGAVSHAFDALEWRFLEDELALEVATLTRFDEPLRSAPFLLTNANLVDLETGVVRRGFAVGVREGKIDWVGATSDIPAADERRRIDAAGRYLLPGLVDMHVHLLTTSADYLTLLASGVTTVREMDGFPWLLERKELAAENRLLAPTMFVTGQILNRSDFGGYARAVKTPEEARRAVREQAQDGYDAIKIHNSLSTELFDAILDEAKKVDLDVVGHIPQPVDVQYALATRLRTAEHFKGYLDDNTLSIRDVDWTTPTREGGVFLTPTFHTYREHLRGEEAAAILAGAEAKLIHPWRLARWQRAAKQPLDELTELRQTILPKSREIFRRLLPHTDRWLAGTDSGSYDLMVPGPALHDELKIMEDLGMPTIEVLRSATSRPAEAMRWADRIGGVAVGRQADLLLLARNPLLGVGNLQSLESLVLRGVWMPDVKELLPKFPDAIEIDSAQPPSRAEVERQLQARLTLKRRGYAFNHFQLMRLERLIREAGFEDLAKRVDQLR